MDVPAGIGIRFTAVVKDGADVKNVRFYDGDQLLGGPQTSPWRVMLEGAEPGPHSVFAMWDMADGKTGVSNPVLIVEKR
jgi:hypothetical protein